MSDNIINNKQNKVDIFMFWCCFSLVAHFHKVVSLTIIYKMW